MKFTGTASNIYNFGVQCEHEQQLLNSFTFVRVSVKDNLLSVSQIN